LKERWRVSVKAQIKRLSDLDRISSDHAGDLYKLYSAKGWNKEEPLDSEWDIPEPTNLSDSLTVIVDSGLRTKADLLAVEFTMSPGDVENLANLPPGWFLSKPGEVIHLKQDKSRSVEVARGAPGVVVPFGRK
jgi:hypothetical protein